MQSYWIFEVKPPAIPDENSDPTEGGPQLSDKVR